MSDLPKVKLETNLGTITVELFEKEAPLTVANFLHYVDEKHYNGTIFHRVIKGFMIQGGGMDCEMFDMPTKSPIKNEAANGLQNKIGTLAMARTNVVDSATAQFFINTADNDFLNHQNTTPRGFGYCVFGRVIDGMDVVRLIEDQETCAMHGHDDVPASPVTILRAVRV